MASKRAAWRRGLLGVGLSLLGCAHAPGQVKTEARLACGADGGFVLDLPPGASLDRTELRDARGTGLASIEVWWRGSQDTGQQLEVLQTLATPTAVRSADGRGWERLGRHADSAWLLRGDDPTATSPCLLVVGLKGTSADAALLLGRVRFEKAGR